METRFGKLGRFEAKVFLEFPLYFSSLHKRERKKYILMFLKELENYSDKPRRKGEPVNEGCVRELEDLTEINIRCPEKVARVVKERWHTKYQKKNTSREMKGFFEEIKKYLQS